MVHTAIAAVFFGSLRTRIPIEPMICVFAAAAIISLKGQGRVGPGAIAASDVKVTKTPSGWDCGAHTQLMTANVQFDGEGRCKGVNKFYSGPLPP